MNKSKLKNKKKYKKYINIYIMTTGSTDFVYGFDDNDDNNYFLTFIFFVSLWSLYVKNVIYN